MLRKFSVKGFKNFASTMCLDLSQSKNYEFHGEYVKDGIIRVGAIFGKNSSGKSNLGLALFDIVNHLTDKEKTVAEAIPYLNLNIGCKTAEFHYQFLFDETVVEYQYTKTDPESLETEELIIDNETVLYYNYTTKENICRLKGAENLNLGLENRKLSFVKYVFNNTVLEDTGANAVLKKFIAFAENMLMFYSLGENRFYGYKQGSESLSESIVKLGKLDAFQTFLNELEIPCRLVAREVDGMYQIYNIFDQGESNFFRTASTGTKALTLFYYWLINSEDVSFIYMDEFDAYYHYELAERVVREILKEKPAAQILFTSHNTNLMSNQIFRPDCLFVMQRDSIKSMAFLTDKELREAHNLQKMYKAGAFNE